MNTLVNTPFFADRIIPFPHPDPAVPLPSTAAAGGKGMSLARMAAAGFAVPPGLILTPAFFKPWFEILYGTAAWSAFLDADNASLAASAHDLKEAAGELALGSDERRALGEALASYGATELFAVRSSSPEEDLAGASFAGGYETILGVTKDAMEAAIRAAFVSCLDIRVVLYKKEHGFDYRSPTIAVVIQRQLDARAAGVGFSLNPVTNTYDEVVINANWGLGETVVAGIVSPDEYVVDKRTGEVLERRCGKKEVTIRLSPGGGTHEETDPRQDEFVLPDDELSSVAALTQRVEEEYGRPMDIEWAIAKGRLYLLQARPITTHVMLPDILVTAPGKRKNLYLDVTIAVQGLMEPLSALGTDIIRRLLGNASEAVFGENIGKALDHAIFYVTAGRIYLNLSNVFALAGRDRFADVFSIMDPAASAALRAVDEDEYRNPEFSRMHLALDALLHSPDKLGGILEGRLMPERARAGWVEIETKLKAELLELAGRTAPFAAWTEGLLMQAVSVLVTQLLPLVAQGKRAEGILQRFFGDEPTGELADDLDRLSRALPGNITVEMGLDLARLADSLADEEVASAVALEERIGSGDLPGKFLDAWKNFLERYGHRGPLELDAAIPRFRERPGLILAQVLSIRTAPAPSPFDRFTADQAARHEARERLCERARKEKGLLQGKRFASLCSVVENLSGLRESAKYWVIFTIDLIRNRALEIGRQLAADGRIDSVQDIFSLEVSDVERALANPDIDLRAVINSRMFSFGAVPLPKIIDSRGRILRPPRRPANEGELAGYPVSSGMATGRVKVLHTPDEKPLLPGEILVAHATDPGWTPLFLNAGAVLLEVGGTLQHGALVAREYGKPCVVGIEGVTERLPDGTLVEVDGSTGIVRRLEPSG